MDMTHTEQAEMMNEGKWTGPENRLFDQCTPFPTQSFILQGKRTGVP
jgi:hypothetical protein